MAYRVLGSGTNGPSVSQNHAFLTAAAFLLKPWGRRFRKPGACKLACGTWHCPGIPAGEIARGIDWLTATSTKLRTDE